MLALFFIIKAKSDCINYQRNTFNSSITCPNDCIIVSNSLFRNIDKPILDCELNRIEFNDCIFTNVLSIVNSNRIESFYFNRNCCNNNGNSLNSSCISVSPKSECNFIMNTFSGFVGNKESNFFYFASKKIRITNLNLTNNRGFDFATSISQPSDTLQFDDTTFCNNENFNGHIFISIEAGSFHFDRIYDDGSKSITFLETGNDLHFIITRAYLKNDMNITIRNGTVWFVHSYISGTYPEIGATVPLSGVFVDSSINSASTYFINHLSVPECRTKNIETIPPPRHTVASSMKLKIAFSFIGGAILGVAVFLIIYFTVKYSIKCYQKKQDQQHPVFELN